MILGLLLFLAANAAVIAGAWAILRHVRTGNPSVDTLLFLLIRLALISVAVMAAGLASFLTAAGLGAIGILLGLIGLLVSGGPGDRPRLQFPDAGRVLAAFALVVALRLILQVWFFSPHLGDAVAYHLPKVGQWVRAGGFTREMGLHPHVTFSAGFELVEAWWVVFLRHDVLIEMAGVEFLVLAVAAVYSLSQFIGLPERESCLAALLYGMVPGLHLSTTSCLNDTPVAALILVTAVLAAWKAPVPLTLLAVGLGFGIKPTYAYALPGILVLAFLSRKEPGLRSPSVRTGEAIAAASLAVGGFWYVRNLIWYGNPFYPVGSPSYEGKAVAVQAGPSLRSLWANASDLVEKRIYDNQGIHGANVDLISGWGPVVFACGLLAFPLALREGPRLRRLATGFLVSLGSCFLLIIHDPWCLKYVFFFPAVLCLAIAWVARAVRGVSSICALALIIAFAGTLLPYDLQWRHLRILAAQPWRTRTALVLREPDLREGKVGCFGGYSAFSYHLYGPNFSREVVYLRSTSPDQLADDMNRSGLRILYAASESAEHAQILDVCIRRHLLHHIGGRLFSLQQ